MDIFRKIFVTFSEKDPEAITSFGKSQSRKYGSFVSVSGCQAFQKSSSHQNRMESVHNPNHATPFWGTIFHIIFLSGISPVILLPSSFIVVRLLTGSTTMVFIFMFYLYSTYMLVWSANEMCKLKLISSVSYSDLMYEAFDLGPFFLKPLARTAQLSVSCIIILGWYCSCIILGLLVIDHLQTLCQSWLHTYLAIQNIVCIIVIPVLLLNLVRRFKFLEPCSTLGCLLNMTAILLVFLNATNDSMPWNLRSTFGSVEKIPKLMGVIFGDISISGLVTSLKDDIKLPNKFEASCESLSIAYVIIFAMYFGISLFFCLEYGTHVPEEVIDIIPTNLITCLITSIMNVTGLYLLIPIAVYLPLDMLWNNMLRERTKLLRHKFTWKYVFRALLVIMIFLVVCIHINVSFILSFFGTVTSSLDGLVFPTIIHSLMVWRGGQNSLKTALILMKNLIMLMFGLVLTLAGILDCVGPS